MFFPRRPITMASSSSKSNFSQYFGHSSYNVWSFSILFASPHAMQLQNAGRPAVVAQWGCWNTYYVSPRFETLGHKLLLSGDQGAAAVLGSATLSDAESQGILAQIVTPLLVTPGVTIGDAMVHVNLRGASPGAAR